MRPSPGATRQAHNGGDGSPAAFGAAVPAILEGVSSDLT
jgi:hypothetical protein